MRLATVQGLVRRRILVNFRVDPAVIQRQLPAPFQPKLLGDAAMAGICLIRLEQVRPPFLPAPIGWSSENAAHRIAVCWRDDQGEVHEGVYIPRRDTDSWLIQWAGGRLFPGEHHRARFVVRDEDGVVTLSMRSADGRTAVAVRGRRATMLPPSSRFRSLTEASDFFAAGALGYSGRRDGRQLDGLRLHTHRWHIEPLDVAEVASSYFGDATRFPRGSVDFDCALVMRDLPHHWLAEAPLAIPCSPGGLGAAGTD